MAEIVFYEQITLEEKEIRIHSFLYYFSACKKVFVPDACKDERYWMRRTKNNIAAKRSREARRIKENQIALRAAFLEKENNALKDEVNKIKEENVNLQKKLSQYEQVGK